MNENFKKVLSSRPLRVYELMDILSQVDPNHFVGACSGEGSGIVGGVTRAEILAVDFYDQREDTWGTFPLDFLVLDGADSGELSDWANVHIGNTDEEYWNF